MKLSIILATMCAVVFFSAGVVRADETSELKEQIKALQGTINAQQKSIEALVSKVEAVEAKQESQAKEVKKVPELAQKISDLKSSSLGQLTEGLSVGGHIKLFMFDRTQGKRNGVSQHTNLSAGVGTHAFILYVSKQLNDWLKLDTATDFGISASATPTLGSNITRAYNTTVSTTLRALNMQMMLPKGYELKVGIFNPMFSEEFAKETFWSEQFNMNDGLCNLETWHDSGIELYKNFDFPKWSLPVYLSYLNGASQYVDNNDNKMVLLHIAPEFFQTKLRLLGSLAYGKWDDGDNGGALFTVGGADWKYKKFNLTGEYIYKKYGHVRTLGDATADGKKEGFYVRAMYTFNPTWRALIKRSHVEAYKTGFAAGMLSDNYDTTALAVNYFITPNSTIIGEYQHIDALRSDGLDEIKADRFTMGWRTTF